MHSSRFPTPRSLTVSHSIRQGSTPPPFHPGMQTSLYAAPSWMQTPPGCRTLLDADPLDAEPSWMQIPLDAEPSWMQTPP